ncbi:MAG TPA: glycosyltransferase [Gaiellaceae bacterium]|jgi:glycosyltransferase involved in cell wall biosynthesis
MPKVTVGLPVYNGARYLSTALDSLGAQTFADLQIVISDNCSTDETEEICRAFAARDERVRYIRRAENRGAAWNFNSVVAETTSPYFKWAAADDVLAPSCVERCVEVLDEISERVVLVYPETKLIDEEGTVIGDWRDGVDLHQPAAHDRLRSLVENLVLGHPMFGVARRHALERTHLNGSFPSSDYVLLAELAMLGEIRRLDEPLFFRRIHADSSRNANTSSEALAEWFGSSSTVHYEHARLFAEHLRAIASSPIPRGERVLCLGTFLDAGLRRWGVHIVEEVLRVEYTGGRPPFKRRPRAEASA